MPLLKEGMDHIFLYLYDANSLNRA